MQMLSTVKVKVLREYGPYLDGKPNIPANTVCFGIVDALSSGEVKDFTVKYRHDPTKGEYHILAEDCKLLEVGRVLSADEYQKEWLFARSTCPIF